MATQISASPANEPDAPGSPASGQPAPSGRAGHWHIVVPVLALLVQALPPLVLCAFANAAYDPATHPPHAWERPVSLLLLLVFAFGSFALASAGVYGLLTRARPIIAGLLIVLCCVPALLAGATYLHALLVFLTWV